MYNSAVCYKHRAREEEVWWATVDGENGYDSENRSPIEKLLTQEWFADIVEHKIKVTLQRYGSFVAKLYIDEELRDEFVRFERKILVNDPRRKEPKHQMGRGARKKWQKSYR